MSEPWVVWSIIALALSFDFINGFHDAANSIATVVSTRVLSPRAAVVWAAFFNFIAFLFFGLHVAKTIGKGTVDPQYITLAVVTAGLVGAIVWDLLTWWWGLPASSSHALVGGLSGAALVHAGPKALVVGGLLKIGAFIFIAPFLGLVMGFGLMVAIYWMWRRAAPARRGQTFRRLQPLSPAAPSPRPGGERPPQTVGSTFLLAICAGGG